jgi:hypothetical protein
MRSPESLPSEKARIALGVRQDGKGRNRPTGAGRADDMTAFTMEAYYGLVGRDDPIAREDLFALLGKTQDRFGRVPRAVVEDLAARSGVSEARIWGALTAYPDFDLSEEN